MPFKNERFKTIMGTGGILGKKSWHVGRKENRQRVIRDEEAAKRKEEAREKEDGEVKRARVERELTGRERREEASSATGTAGRSTETDERDASTRGKASTRTSDARFDASFRLGGSAGSGNVPWYAAGVGSSSSRPEEVAREDAAKRKPSLLDAVKVVGKAKKLSKKDRRKREQEKLLELRAARERREERERERMKREMMIG